MTKEQLVKEIKDGQQCEFVKNCLSIMLTLRQECIYVVCDKDESTIYRDGEGDKYYLAYLLKPQKGYKKFSFVDFERLAEQENISLIISVSEKEPESILLEEPSGLTYFFVTETDQSKKTVIFI